MILAADDADFYAEELEAIIPDEAAEPYGPLSGSEEATMRGYCMTHLREVMAQFPDTGKFITDWLTHVENERNRLFNIILTRTEADEAATVGAVDLRSLIRSAIHEAGQAAWGIPKTHKSWQRAINAKDQLHKALALLDTHPQDASAGWVCYVGDMKTSAGMQYVVTVERESEQSIDFWHRSRITPYVFGEGERYKAEYEAACLGAFLNGTPCPEILQFKTEDAALPSPPKGGA
jgi:hypothetical protein